MFSIEQINKLNYSQTKQAHIECEKSSSNSKESNLLLLGERLQLFKENIDHKQYDLLDGFFYYNWHKNWKRESDRDYHKDNVCWAERLDEAHIPWVIQNSVARAADERENGWRSLGGLVSKLGIKKVSDLDDVVKVSGECLAIDEEFKDDYISLENKAVLDNLSMSCDKSLHIV